MLRSHSLSALRKFKLAGATSTTASCTCNHGSKFHASSKAYNPYRPDPPELPKEPRKVVMKNLKFGRLAQAASAGVEGARRSLAETTAESPSAANSFHSSSRPSSSLSSSPPSKKQLESFGDSSNASYRNARSLPSASRNWILLAVGAASAVVAYSSLGKSTISNEASIDLSTVDSVSACLPLSLFRLPIPTY